MATGKKYINAYRKARRAYLERVRRLEKSGVKVKRIKLVKNPTQKSIERLQAETTRKMKRAFKLAQREAERKERRRQERERRAGEKLAKEIDILEANLFTLISSTRYSATARFLREQLEKMKQEAAPEAYYNMIRTALESDSFMATLRYDDSDPIDQGRLRKAFMSYLEEVGVNQVPTAVMMEFANESLYDSGYEPNDEEVGQFYPK